MITPSLMAALAVIAILVIICFVLLSKYYSLSDLYEQLASERRTGSNGNKRSKFNLLVSGLATIQKAGAGSAAETAMREDFYQTVVDCACDLIDARCGSLMLIDYAKDELMIAAAKNIKNTMLLNTRIKPGEGVAGRAYMNGEVIFVAEPGNNRMYEGYKGTEDEQTPFIALPLKVKDRPFGVLNLHLASKDATITEYELKFLNIFVNAASSMLENINMYENVSSYYHDMAETLVRVIAANDRRKGKMAENAGRKAKRLAQELDLDEETQKNIEYAALLCNIGRLGVDSEILHKKGKLTPEEYEELKQHIYLSYQILAPIKYFVPVAQMVLYHQEWYNGTGYPDKLSGEHIPLGARIISVVNSWEAMVSEQPYRPALSYEQARLELEKGSSRQFDPVIVATFLKLEKAGWPERY
ncbi:MAG: GAF domain-containing protein [Elusimicrobiales bacterium]|nr:GAF domain-containing protein [Elusimicrobiales bacterium]